MNKLSILVATAILILVSGKNVMADGPAKGAEHAALDAAIVALAGESGMIVKATGDVKMDELFNKSGKVPTLPELQQGKTWNCSVYDAAGKGSPATPLYKFKQLADGSMANELAPAATPKASPLVENFRIISEGNLLPQLLVETTKAGKTKKDPRVVVSYAVCETAYMAAGLTKQAGYDNNYNFEDDKLTGSVISESSQKVMGNHPGYGSTLYRPRTSFVDKILISAEQI